MATLHFDTDAGRRTASIITTASQVFDEQLIAVANEVNNLVGNEWVGNSASQFQSEFQNWSHQMRNVQEQLEALRQRLEREIADWEQAASALN